MLLFVLLIAISIIAGACIIETATVISHSNTLITLIGNEDSLHGTWELKQALPAPNSDIPFKDLQRKVIMRGTMSCLLNSIVYAVLKVKVKRMPCDGHCAEAGQVWSGVSCKPITQARCYLRKYFHQGEIPSRSLNIVEQTPCFVTSPCGLWAFAEV